MKNRKPQNARNARRKLLINRGVNKLPRKIIPILKFLGIPAYKYGDNQDFIECNGLKNVASKNDGFALMTDYNYCIFYNEKKSASCIRFTLAHELGHIICGHLFDTTENGMFIKQKNTAPTDIDNIAEREANAFASKLLSSACVISELKLTVPQPYQKSRIHTTKII